MALDPKLLLDIPLFAELPAEQLTYIADHARVRTYRADERILHQDDPGETLYVVLRGMVKISMTEPDGDEVFLAVLAKGENFGELSLIDSKFRSADVQTQEETQLLMLDRTAFNHLVGPSVFARNLMSILATRNRRANSRIGALARLPVSALVARQIVEFAELYGKSSANGAIYIPIRLTQSNLGDLVGASRERVNQVMKYYKETGCITVDPSYHVTVHKIAELRKHAQ